MILSLLLLASTSAPAAQSLSIVTCTPETVDLGRGAERVQNPIAYALERVEPGGIVQLEPGEYPPFAIGFGQAAHWNARTSGGTIGAPITIDGQGFARIQSRGQGDTISIGLNTAPQHIHFRGLIIEPGYRAGVMFFKPGADAVYEGFHFIDCDIVGGWNHAQHTGQPSKWGVWGHSLADFVFKGTKTPAAVRNIAHEHGFYLQNPRGDITIEHVAARQLGRTFCQFTARSSDGPPGIGNITVRGCTIEDVAIAAGDNFKGGSAITIGSGLSGRILIEGNTYRAGFDPSLKHLTTEGVPYGTSALVCWNEGGEAFRGELVLKDNDFEIAPDCGDRPLVSIAGCKSLELVGKNRLVAGANGIALALEEASGKIGALKIDPKTTFQGAVTKGGATLSQAELAGLLGR